MMNVLIYYYCNVIYFVQASSASWSCQTLAAIGSQCSAHVCSCSPF